MALVVFAEHFRESEAADMLLQPAQIFDDPPLHILFAAARARDFVMHVGNPAFTQIA